jgi:hypothetical protein
MSENDELFNLSPQAFIDFKNIDIEEFGNTNCDEEMHEAAIRLLKFTKFLLKPTPSTGKVKNKIAVIRPILN